MANQSIFNAFERMWQHIIAKISTKADVDHNHDDIYELKGASAKPDWKQNDETASGYIKNRTHWADIVTEVLFEEQTVTAVRDRSNCIVDLTASMYMYNCMPGQIYIVTLDGVAYQCTSWSHPSDPYYQYFGDSRLCDTGSGIIANVHQEDVPFGVEFSTTFSGTAAWDQIAIDKRCIYLTDTNAHTLKIELMDQVQTTYHKLDENFIPDTVARKEYVDEQYNTIVEDVYETILTAEATNSDFYYENENIKANFESAVIILNGVEHHIEFTRYSEGMVGHYGDVFRSIEVNNGSIYFYFGSKESRTIEMKVPVSKIKEECLPSIIQYSQTDLTAGTSPLATGSLYLVYE